MSPALESEFLTTEPPGSFLKRGITINSTDASRLFDIHGRISSSKVRLLYPLTNNRCVDFPLPVPMLDIGYWVPNSRLHAGDTLARKLKKKKECGVCLPRFPDLVGESDPDQIMNIELQTGRSSLGERKGCEESAVRGGGAGFGVREAESSQRQKFHVAEAKRIRWPNVGGGCRRAAQTRWALY